MARTHIIDVTDRPERMENVRELFREYAAEIGIDLDFQGFEDELADLPGCYAAPRGCILLARVGDDIAGCIGLRPLEDDTAEVKRMYVRPAQRGHKLGRKLLESILGFATEQGYRKVRLDTLASMGPARKLYEAFGFRQTGAYYDNPLPDVVYYELDFHDAARELVRDHADLLGDGRWAVALYNDDETTMDDVVDLLMYTFDYDYPLARALMLLTHFHGSAIVRRYQAQADANVTTDGIKRYAAELGMALQADVYEIREPAE